MDVRPGFAGLSGAIDSGDVVNMFRFVAPANESIQVDLNPSGGSNFLGDLYAFDAAGNQVANDYNLGLLQGDTSNSVQFNVKAGQTYYIQVAANRGRIGTYDLRFAAAPTIAVQSDGFGQTFGHGHRAADRPIGRRDRRAARSSCRATWTSSGSRPSRPLR